MTRSRNQVVLNRTADSDLSGILDSLIIENRAYAIKLNKRFEFRFHMLERNPFLGAECSELGQGFRRTTIDNYVIYYRVVAPQVEVIRILHGACDHGPLLEDQ